MLAQGDLTNLLQQTGLVSRIVLGLLLVASIFSWAIILKKWGQFSRMRRQSRRFIQTFRASARLLDPALIANAAEGSPLVSVYSAGYRELASQVGNPTPGKLKSLNAISVNMHIAAAGEIQKMEHWMPWLATTGSVAPFVGLFGTVWGVIDAFAGLGEAGAASLRAVAPGISEALIATAAGLFAAIPAVIAYNHFLHRIKDFSSQMHNFASEFAAQVEKQYSE
ncbi:MAG: MotA/TolQ/ExbB proton channel family protein [Candidatus Acidiferrales bacterium]